MKQEFEKLLAAVKVYTDFYGYGLERTITSPNVGNHVHATMQRFNAFNGELYVKVDKLDDEWQVDIYIKNDLGEKTFEKSVKSKENFVKVGKQVQSALSQLPRNEIKAPMDEAFLRDFDRSALYIIEQEFMETIS